jgi:hypothetical protein
MRTTTAMLVSGLATLASVSAAQPPRKVHRLAPAAITATAPNTLTVQNDRKVPVDIDLDDGQFEQRLGVVPPLAVAALPLPKWLVQGRDSVRVVAYPEGQVDALASDEIGLAPPARIALEVPPWGYTPPPAPTDTMTAVLPPAEQKGATVTVDNPRAVPVKVLAEDGPFDTTLGEVPAHSRATLVVPSWLTAPDESVQLYFDPKNGTELASDPLELKPGEHVGVRVPTH